MEARGRDEDATEANLAKLLWLRARQAGAKTAVAFCRDIRRSRLLVDVLRGAGVRAEHLDGSTSEKDRKRTLAELREGIVEVVANASLLAEGFDEPSLSAVILVRPTQSTALFVQQVGRALRPYPEKTCGFVVDAIGAAEQHGSAFGRLHRLEPDDGGTLARDLSDRAAVVAPPTFRLSAKKAPRRRAGPRLRPQLQAFEAGPGPARRAPRVRHEGDAPLCTHAHVDIHSKVFHERAGHTHERNGRTTDPNGPSHAQRAAAQGFRPPRRERSRRPPRMRRRRHAA